MTCKPLKYPQWQAPLLDAVLEFNPERLSVKVQNTEKVIYDRLDALSRGGDFREQEALADALATLRVLRGQ